MDALNVVDIQEASLGTTEQARIILDGIPLRWRVDDAEHFLKMIVQKLSHVKQGSRRDQKPKVFSLTL